MNIENDNITNSLQSKSPFEDNKLFTSSLNSANLTVKNEGKDSIEITPAFHPYFNYTDENEVYINGEKFEAQTYCINWDKGDRVIFIEGSPYGACATAVLYNLDKEESCDVWCE